MADAGTHTDARARHGRDAVVEAALTVLDEVGLADLTMRRMAAALEVQPSALYWHFENKQSLLAAVADRIVADGVRTIPPDAVPLAVAQHLRRALLARRDGADIVIGTQALALGAGEAHERLARSLAARHSSRVADLGATVLLHYLLGHTAVVQERLQAAALGVVTGERTVEFAAEFDAGVGAVLRGLDPRISDRDREEGK